MRDHIKTTCGRVEEVSFTADTPAERAIETAVWPAIHPLVERIDRRLRRINARVVRQLEAEDRAAGDGQRRRGSP